MKAHSTASHKFAVVFEDGVEDSVALGPPPHARRCWLPSRSCMAIRSREPRQRLDVAAHRGRVQAQSVMDKRPSGELPSLPPRRTRMGLTVLRQGGWAQRIRRTFERSPFGDQPSTREEEDAHYAKLEEELNKTHSRAQPKRRL